MPSIALNLRNPGPDIQQWHVKEPAYRRYIEFGEQSYPGLMQPATISLTATGSSARCLMHAFQSGKEIHVSLPEFLESAGFVTGVKDFREPIDGLRSGTFEVKLTKAPWKNHMAEAQVWGTTRPGRILGVDLAGPGSDYTACRITGLPTPPAGTIAQRIYGTPFLKGALDTMKEHMKVSVQDAIRRASEDLMIYGHPNCRCTPVGITTKERPVKIRNRFYVAAPSVTTHSEQDQDNTSDKVHLSMSPNDRSGKWTRKDQAAAVEHAQQMLNDNPKLDHVAVVRIVKVVRRPKPKFIVEDVK